MIAQASSRVLMTKSLNAFFSMSVQQQEPGQRRKSAVFGWRIGESVNAASDESRDPGRKATCLFRDGSPSRMRFQLHPGRGVVAGLFARSHVAVDAGRLQPLRRGLVEQEMVDPDAGVAGEGVPPIVPEGVDRLLRDGDGEARRSSPAPAAGDTGPGARAASGRRRPSSPACRRRAVEVGMTL